MAKEERGLTDRCADEPFHQQTRSVMMDASKNDGSVNRLKKRVFLILRASSAAGLYQSTKRL